MKRSIRMITLKQILPQICPGDWFISLDLKDAYFHIQVAPHHRQFLRFTFEGVAYQYKVLPFGLSLAPRTFTRCMDAALSPLRQMGIHILNYLDDWLILAQSQAVLTSHKTLLLSHLNCLGLRVNFARSILSPSQRVLFLGTVIDSNCLSGASHDNSVPRGLLQGRYRPSAQSFPENAGPYGSGYAGTSVGSASHATHPVLAEAEGSFHGLALRTPPRNGDSGCVSTLARWPVAKARRDPRHGTQKEGCHDRRFQQGLGGAVRGQTDLRPMVRRGVGPAHQLPRNASSVSGLLILPAGHSGTPRANTLRLEATLHAGEQPSCVGSEQSALTEGDACAGQNESRSRHFVEEQCLFRGRDAPHARGSENLGNLWQDSTRPLRLQRQLSLPNIFYKEHGCLGPRMDQPSALCLPLSRSATAGTRANQGTMAQADSNSPPLKEPTVGVGVIPAVESSSRADPLEMGPPLSSKRHDMASTARVMGPACVAARQEPFVLPERVLNAMVEARAPSTRRLYALKNGPFFSTWCQDRDLDPVTSDVSVVLSFLQEMLDKQCSSSTIKVYAAAIAANFYEAPGE